jgi:CheY-like chemotaxis protein
MRTALIIDDSQTITLYHSTILKSFGFESKNARNGLEGLELCLMERFDLILADINMPIMDGYEFVKRVRKYDNFKETPIVFISTIDSDESKSKALLSGVNLYLVKPLDVEIFKDIINSFFKGDL